jgi:hypothetical protein
MAQNRHTTPSPPVALIPLAQIAERLSASSILLVASLSAAQGAAVKPFSVSAVAPIIPQGVCPGLVIPQGVCPGPACGRA